MSDILAIELQLNGFELAMSRIETFGKACGSLPNTIGSALSMPKGQSNSGQKNSSVNPQMQSIKASNQAMQSYFNAVNAQFRAQAAFIRLNKMTAPKQAPQAPDFGKAFNRLIMSSRFSIQNGHVQFQPLVGNLVRAFGPLVEALGPLAAPVLAVTAAIVGLAAAADKASEVLKGWNLAGARAGTTGENLGQMAGIGHFLGMKPEELAGMVRQFSEELGSGGTATAMGIRHGIRDFSGGNPFIGPLDSFQNFKKLIDEMSSATEDEAMRMVRAFGAAGEAAYQFRGLSKEQHDALIDAYKGMSTPAMIAAQKQHQYATAMLSIQWEKLILASTPFINALTLMTDSIIMGMEYFKQFVIMQFSGLIEIDKWIKRIIGMKVDDGDAKTAMQQSQESHAKAISANTEALYHNTNAMRQTFGGGPSARGAMPEGWRGTNFDTARKMGYALGAFSQ